MLTKLLKFEPDDIVGNRAYPQRPPGDLQRGVLQRLESRQLLEAHTQPLLRLFSLGKPVSTAVTQMPQTEILTAAQPEYLRVGFQQLDGR